MKHRKIFLSFLLALAMVVGLLPGMSLTAYADNTETLLTTITATGQTTYGQSVEGVVTVTLTNIFDYEGEYGWLWYGTITVEPVEGYTITKCRFKQNNKTPLDDDLAPFSIVMNMDDFRNPCSVTTSTGQKGGGSMDGVTSIEVYGYATPAAVEDTTTYTLTIPSTLAVSGSGWNDAGGISATGTLATGKKLTVTASSANSWALKSGENSVGYTLTTAEGGSQTTSWEFTELSSTATKKDMGIIVEDYSAKPAGTYTDIVTFTASVEDARQLYSLTLTGPYSGETLVMEYYEGDTWNDMVAKYPNTLKVYSGYVAFGSDGFIYPKNGGFIPATAKIDPNETYEVQ